MTMEPKGIEQAAGQQERPNQLRFVVDVVLRRFTLIVACAVVGSLVLGLYGYWRSREVRAEQFRASVRLDVESSPLERALGSTSTPALRTSMREIIQQISPTDIARPAAEMLIANDLMEGGPQGARSTSEEFEALVGALAGSVQVEPVQDTSAGVVVSASAPTQEQALERATAAARSLTLRNREFVNSTGEDAHELIEERIQETAARLDKAEAAEWQFKQEMGFRSYETFEADMTRLSNELSAADAEIEGMRQQLVQTQQELALNNEQLPAALSHIDNVVIQGLLDQLADLLQEQFRMGVTYTSEYGPLRDLQAQIDETQKAILQAVRELDAQVGSGQALWDRRQDLREQYRTLQLNITSTEIKRSSMERRLEELIAQYPKLKEKRPEYATLVRTAEQLRGQLDRLITHKTELEEALRRGTGGLVRAEPAVALGSTRPPEASRLYIDFLIGAAVGLLLGFGLAVMLEISDTSIKSVEDVGEYIGLEVIGTIPKMHFGRGRSRGRPRGTFVEIRDEGEVDACIVTQHDPKSPISEAYRTLRTNFQFATIQDRPRTVMVTSAIPGEGKTTTAVNMAVTFADSGFRVLLVDTDLRRPHVHHVLKMQRGPGLADALRQGLDFNPLVRQTRVRNLWTISSGHVPPNPSELIGSERMRNIVQEMGMQFDLVLFDAPSILVVTDPLLLATNVDSVVLVVAANQARRETIARARKLMDTAHASMAGVVLNGLEVSRRHYYYYYYYYDDSTSGRRRRWILS